MVGVIVSAFLLCWLPFAVMFAGSPFSSHIGHFFESNELADTVTWLGNTAPISRHHDDHLTLSGYVNSGLNPFIYALMNTSIRSSITKLAKRMCPCVWRH